MKIVSVIFQGLSNAFTQAKENYEDMEHEFFREKLKIKIEKDPGENEVSDYIKLRKTGRIGFFIIINR